MPNERSEIAKMFSHLFQLTSVTFADNSAIVLSVKLFNS